MGSQDKHMPIVTFEDVCFSYPPKDEAPSHTKREAFGLKNMVAQITMGSRLVIVGRNGAGKSTLIKLLQGELHPTSGEIKKHANLSVGYVMQNHLNLLIDHLDKTPVEFIQFYIKEQRGHTCSGLEIRQHLGSFGLHGDLALSKIGKLSGGQKSRVVFSLVTWDEPHLLILDEPTNHLDFESSQALSAAIARSVLYYSICPPLPFLPCVPSMHCLFPLLDRFFLLF
jgi:ATPase subunit of ABC transporter with duplicated ATPase domains